MFVRELYANFSTGFSENDGKYLLARCNQRRVGDDDRQKKGSTLICLYVLTSIGDS